MRSFWPLLLLVGLLGASSCASTSGYKHYVVDTEHDSLRAPDPKNDLPLRQTCLPDTNNKAKCDALLSDDFFAMEKELLELRAALKQCQGGK